MRPHSLNYQITLISRAKIGTERVRRLADDDAVLVVAGYVADIEAKASPGMF
jgi:ribosomal protein L18E